MTIWQRIAREPNAILGVIVGVYGLLVAFDVLTLNAEQVGAVTAFAGAVVFLLRWLTTPASEVVAQQRPGQELPVSGPALDNADKGQPVVVKKILGKAFTSTFSRENDERGESALGVALLVLVVLAIVVLATRLF